MPELPDIDVYVARIGERVRGQVLEDIRVSKPFLVRSFEPPLEESRGRMVRSVHRLGKRVVIELKPDYWLVLHLMVAGRLHWHADRPAIRGRHQLAAFDFSNGSLLLTEAGTKKRASLFLVRGEEALATHDPGGIEPLECSITEFLNAIERENRTLKRALTNPRTISGIGNAYSDEILHAARLSPVRLTSQLNDDEKTRLYEAMQEVLAMWRDRLLAESVDQFPEKVTAFREGMTVHGRFGNPCPACGAKVARICYKSSETNYCPGCQTGGKVLADRSLSRLLKDDWPGTL
ncbi:MAG: formamidopyrimidine-DNA glycosylase [Gammaproteobacteria bacterium]|nr:formamidopyrimidine-DNA glycosylase [Gammaproteobacteria bacterium]MDH5345367.1 formamidopyrimidine-DNA glycosylase [Gammaproteobacteria bacterium]